MPTAATGYGNLLCAAIVDRLTFNGTIIETGRLPQHRKHTSPRRSRGQLKRVAEGPEIAGQGPPTAFYNALSRVLHKAAIWSSPLYG